MRFGLLSIVIAIFLTGCATARGPTYPAYKSKTASIPDDQARLTVFRRRAGLAAAARSVRLKLDSAEIGSLDVNGFFSFDAVPGEHTLSVDLPDTIGTCDLPISIQAGEEYFYEVKHRIGSIVGGVLLGYLGQAIEYAGKQCGGSFSIEPVEEAYANSILPRLRLTQ